MFALLLLTKSYGSNKRPSDKENLSETIYIDLPLPFFRNYEIIWSIFQFHEKKCLFNNKIGIFSEQFSWIMRGKVPKPMFKFSNS